MSRIQEYMDLQARKEDLVSDIEMISSNFDWFILKSDRGSIIMREKDRFDHFNPVEVNIRLMDSDNGTRLFISCSNSGYGPVQDNYVRDQYQRLLSAISIASRKHRDAYLMENEMEPSIVEQLKKLAQLHDRGELTDEEFKLAKEKVLNS
ncbi:MAG: SHOCT domain-containing protein [Thermoplasmatota archaeon]